MNVGSNVAVEGNGLEIYPVTGSNTGTGKAIPVQGSKRLRLPDFKTIGTCRW
jgi:hypothetical protein